MIFEIVGQKDKWVIVEKDGNGVEFKRNNEYHESK